MAGSQGRMAKPTHKFERVAFVASDNPEAQSALERLTERYGAYTGDNPDAIVALGGDGLMLQTLHRSHAPQLPIYGMNRGSVGFLMNDYHEDDLHERLGRAEAAVIHPLAMPATDGHRPDTTARSPSTRSRCFARPTRRPSSGSRSTARCASRS